MVEYFYASQTTGARTPEIAVPLNTWLSLRTKVDLPAKTAELFRDGTSIGSITLAPPAAVTTPPQYATVYLGAYSSGKHDGWTFQFDNAALFSP